MIHFAHGREASVEVWWYPLHAAHADIVWQHACQGVHHCCAVWHQLVRIEVDDLHRVRMQVVKAEDSWRPAMYLDKSCACWIKSCACWINPLHANMSCSFYCLAPVCREHYTMDADMTAVSEQCQNLTALCKGEFRSNEPNCWQP